MKRLVCIFAFVLAGCAGLLRPDPQAAEVFRREAEDMVANQAFAAAAEHLSLAIRQMPGDASLYLRQGELFETIDAPEAARDAYVAGAGALPPADPGRTELLHRLALLYALKLDAPEKARRLLDELPAGSARHADLRGVLAQRAGNGREALLNFNTALAQNPPQDLTAAILYHAALAYHHLGDDRNTLGTLYQAINLASSPATARDIEVLWRRLQEPEP